MNKLLLLIPLLLLTSKSGSDEFYTNFLCTVDPNVAIINDKILEDISD